MKKIKAPWFTAPLYSLLILVTLFVAGPLTRVSHAAPAGCYTKTTNNGTTVYQAASCPDQSKTDQTKGANGKCFVSESGQSAFTETNCSTFSVTSGGEQESIDNLVCKEDEKIQYSSDGSTECVRNDGLRECGAGEKVVKVSFNFGCRGPQYCEGKLDCNLNPITDIMFAIFRFLSAGVGLIVIGSIIVAGIQYSASRGNPQATEASIKRITNAIIGLLIYIFMFAILNSLVPGGMFL